MKNGAIEAFSMASGSVVRARALIEARLGRTPWYGDGGSERRGQER